MECILRKWTYNFAKVNHQGMLVFDSLEKSRSPFGGFPKPAGCWL